MDKKKNTNNKVSDDKNKQDVKKTNNTNNKTNTTPNKKPATSPAKKENKNYGANKVNKDEKKDNTKETKTTTTEAVKVQPTTDKKDIKKQQPKRKEMEKEATTTTTTTTQETPKTTATNDKKKQKVTSTNDNKKEKSADATIPNNKKAKNSKKEDKPVEPTTTATTTDSKPEETTTTTTTTSIFGSGSGSIFDALKKQADSQGEQATNQEVLDSFSTSNAFEAPNVDEKIKESKEIDSILEASSLKLNSVGKPMISEEEREIRKKKDAEIREAENPMTIFVSNVDLATSKNELRTLFNKYGKIKHIRFRSLPISKEGANRKATFINKDYHEKRNSCNAYIVFETVDEAKKAASEANGLVFKEKHIRVDVASNTHEKGKSENTVFVGGIPYELENEELFTVFEEQIGDVASVRIVRDKQSGLGKGFAYVEFKKLLSARKAIQMKQFEIGERSIRIFPNKEKPKGKNSKTISQKKKMENRVPRNRKGSNKKQLQNKEDSA